MSEHCPQDGGFIGECGCTHPNHEHSELVKGLLDAEFPGFISEADGEAALKEGFFVEAADEDGNAYKVGFGQRILDHWNDGKHHPNDIKARKERLGFAIDTVRKPESTERDHKGYEGRMAYFKRYRKFGMVVIADPSNKYHVEAFTYIPDRKEKSSKAKAGIEPVCPVHGKGTTAGVFSRLPITKDDTTSGRETQGGAE